MLWVRIIVSALKFGVGIWLVMSASFARFAVSNTPIQTRFIGGQGKLCPYGFAFKRLLTLNLLYFIGSAVRIEYLMIRIRPNAKMRNFSKSCAFRFGRFGKLLGRRRRAFGCCAVRSRAGTIGRGSCGTACCCAGCAARRLDARRGRDDCGAGFGARRGNDNSCRSRCGRRNFAVDDRGGRRRYRHFIWSVRQKISQCCAT